MPSKPEVNDGDRTMSDARPRHRSGLPLRFREVPRSADGRVRLDPPLLLLLLPNARRDRRLRESRTSTRPRRQSDALSIQHGHGQALLLQDLRHLYPPPAPFEPEPPGINVARIEGISPSTSRGSGHGWRRPSLRFSERRPQSGWDSPVRTALRGPRGPRSVPSRFRQRPGLRSPPIANEGEEAEVT